MDRLDEHLIGTYDEHVNPSDEPTFQQSRWRDIEVAWATIGSKTIVLTRHHAEGHATFEWNWEIYGDNPLPLEDGVARFRSEAIRAAMRHI